MTTEANDTYSLLLTCEMGTAPAVKREAEIRKIGKIYELHETSMIVGGCTKEDCIRAAYLMQTPLRVVLLLDEFEVSLDLEKTVMALEKSLEMVDLKDILIKDKTMIVNCDRDGLHEYNSIDVAQEAGRLIKRVADGKLGFSPKVDMKKADVILYFYIHGTKAWFGLDIVGKPPAKRDYKIFNNPHGVKGPVAASLLMLSGWTPEEPLLDPFAADGMVPIEAALFASGTSIHFYDKKLACKDHPLFSEVYPKVVEELDASRQEDLPKIFSFDAQLRNVTAAKKNAKIAGVDKLLSFSKMDLEWIDTKCGAKSVKRIVTHPLETSKHIAPSVAKKTQEELFYAAGYVLQEGGTLTFLSHRPEDLLGVAEKQGFEVLDQVMINTGKQPVWIVSFGKK